MTINRPPDWRDPTRDLTPDEAAGLPPGATHYRAYVGPPDRFDFMSATQFSLLFALGLREVHRVLDFGCGSLRLGRLLIPFLRDNCYFAVEPNRWLIDDALDAELGRDAVALKHPSFSSRDDFDCADFGVTFDYIVAQSIITHAGPDVAALLLGNVRTAMHPGSLCIFTYRAAEAPLTADRPLGWTYPGVVFYEDSEIDRLVGEAGLVGKKLRWYHPGSCR
jgi:SAM-dependent methyltransferase